VPYTVSEWLNLFVRWAHVFSAILWVGATYYFTWLDGQLKRSPAGVWMVHSGGFYTVVKQRTLGVSPDQVHWFRWEALATWASGMLLLGIVYYGGGLMIDATEAPVSLTSAILIALAFLSAGWIVYDLLVRTPLVRNDFAFAAVCLLLIVAGAVALRQVLSARATYIHVGALFGTIMAANVWMRILPPQRRMIAAMSKGEAMDATLGAGAKERSKHNTFMAVPTVFLMISNHFPTATYGSSYSIVVLAMLIWSGGARRPSSGEADPQRCVLPLTMATNDADLSSSSVNPLRCSISFSATAPQFTARRK
jgi:uncharacterized membrane protein